MTRFSNQQGVVLVVALVCILMMTGLAAGLVQYTNREITQVDGQGAVVDMRGGAESCIQESIAWLEDEGINDPPCEGQSIGSQCGQTRTRNMSVWDLEVDNALAESKGAQFGYECRIIVASQETLSNNGGAGFEVGQSQGYGASNTLTKYLYRIEASSTGSDGKTTQLEVIASMVY